MSAQTPMSVEIVQLEAWHVSAIDAQDEQAGEVRYQLERSDGWAALWCGSPVAAGGFVEIWPGRWYAWALFGKWWPQKSIIRAIRSRIDAQKFQRLEMVVDAEFTKAQVFAEWLGFEREYIAKKYMPNGHDAVLYVRFA